MQVDKEKQNYSFAVLFDFVLGRMGSCGWLDVNDQLNNS